MPLELKNIQFTPERMTATTHSHFRPGIKGYVKAAETGGIKASRYVHANALMEPEVSDEEILEYLQDVGALDKFEAEILDKLQQQIDALAKFRSPLRLQWDDAF